MQIDLSLLISVFSAIALVILIFLLIQVSLVVVRFKRIVERLELLSDVRGWLSFFRRNKK